MTTKKQFHVCAGREDHRIARPRIIPGELSAAVLQERQMSWRKKRVSKVYALSDKGNYIGQESWVCQLKPEAAVDAKSIGSQKIIVAMINHKEVCLSDRRAGSIWWGGSYLKQKLFHSLLPNLLKNISYKYVLVTVHLLSWLSGILFVCQIIFLLCLLLKSSKHKE